MSIKIWTAWRVPLTRLNEACDALHQEMLEQAYDRFSRLIASCHRDNPHLNILEIEDRMELLLLKEKLVDCGFQLYVDASFAYLVPYGNFSFCSLRGARGEAQRLPEWFQDYHYQDQTDRPDEISAEEYQARGEKWGELQGGPILRSFTHQVVSSATYSGFAPLTMRWLDSLSDEKRAQLTVFKPIKPRPDQQTEEQTNGTQN